MSVIEFAEKRLKECEENDEFEYMIYWAAYLDGARAQKRELEKSNTMNSKKTIVFDFDGVIHSYSSGWQGLTNIPDPPVPGIKEAIDDLREAGYEVIVVSTRCADLDGTMAVHEWLKKHSIEVDDIRKEKPPAICYIDDRAICFDGHPETLLSKVESFKPWNK